MIPDRGAADAGRAESTDLEGVLPRKAARDPRARDRQRSNRDSMCPLGGNRLQTTGDRFRV